MRNPFAVLLLGPVSLFFLTLALAGQDPTPAPGIIPQEKKPAEKPVEPVKPETPQKKVGAAAKIQDLDRAGKPRWAALNYKLHVTLDNGRTLEGIARNGRLFEKIVVQGKVSDYEKDLKQRYGIRPSQGVSQRFVTADPTDEHVGIRLWHHDATGGYLFLLYRAIVSVKPLKVITPAELKELDERAQRRQAARKDEIQKKWEEYNQKRREALQNRQKNGPEARKAGGTEGKGEKVAGEAGEEASVADDQELIQLFKRFHPSKGWTPGRKRVIEWRKWTLGTFPTEDEKEFLDHYAEWKKAYDKWMSSYAEKETEKNESSDRPGQTDPNKKDQESESSPSRTGP